MSIMVQNPPPDCLAVCMDRAFSPSNRVIVSIPGALPQAGIDRAFGPQEIVQITVLVRTQSAEGANHISLGQRPRKRSDRKKNKG
jgi:hypothetical protein